LHGLSDLDRQLAGRNENEACGTRRNPMRQKLQKRQRKGGRLARSGGSLPKQILTGKQRWNGFPLDRRGFFIAQGFQRGEERRFKPE